MDRRGFRRERGRNNFDHVGRRGGRGRGIERPGDPIINYLIDNELDEEGEVDFRRAMFQHQAKQIEKERKVLNCDEEGAKVELSEVERRRDVVRVRKARNAIEKAQNSLDDEEKELEVAEAITAAEHRIRRH